MLTQTLLDESATKKLLLELAQQIGRAVPPAAHLVLVGIRRRGDSIAESIGEHLRGTRGTLAIGSLDITLYRDEFWPDRLPAKGWDDNHRKQYRWCPCRGGR